MDEPTHRVRSDQSQCPHDQKNHKDRPKHVSTPFYREPHLSGFLSPQCLSPFFPVGLLFGFRTGVNRATAMTHKFLSFFDDSFGDLPKFLPLLIQLIEGLTTAFPRQFPRFFAREQREHQRTDGP
jgi:hypothetical protein